MKVVWLHNNPDRSSGTFMWDIYDAMVEDGRHKLEAQALPLVRKPGDVLTALLAGLNASDADIAHAQFGSLVGAANLGKRRARRILSLRGSDIYWRYGNLRNRLSGLARVFLSWVGAVGSHQVVVMSSAMQSKVSAWPMVSRSKVHLLPDPAGREFWPESVRDLRSRLKASKLKVLSASLVDGNPVKRTHILSQAAKLCALANVDIALETLSGCPRAQVAARMQAVDCIALASTHEGWPNVVKEALLSKIGFVATDVSDLANWADPDQRSMVVKPHPLAFAFAWVDLMVAREIEQAGLAPSLACFHPDAVSLKHVLLYEWTSGGISR